MQRRTFNSLLIASAAAMAAGLGGVGAQAAELTRITIGTNPAGTLYNTMGAAFANVLQEKLGIPSIARPFAGSSVYLPQLQRGEITMGINSALDLEAAFNGEAPYDQKMDKLRGVILMWRAPYAYITKADSGIKSVEDMKGKRVVTAFRAIASFYRFNQAILATGGLTEKDVDAVTMTSVPDSIRAVVEGQVDAAPVALGIPALRQADASVSGGIRVVAIGKQEDKLNTLLGISAFTINPSPVNAGVREPTRVARFDVYLNTSTAMDDDGAYKIAKTLHESWTKLQTDLPALKSLAAKDLVPANNPHPYHPGAVKYFKEAGLWTEANQKQQDAVLK
jgi:TRAP transporter TAXI family solute receptor